MSGEIESDNLQRLHREVRTINHHFGHLKAKLGVPSGKECTLMFLMMLLIIRGGGGAKNSHFRDRNIIFTTIQHTVSA